MDALILARHGESELSALGVTNGDPDRACAITETGRAQARRLGELVAEEPLELCATSAFGRAQETADIALAGRDVPRLVVPELNDIRFGDFEALSFDDYRAWARSATPTDVPSGGGESRAACVTRYVRGFRVLLQRPERLALVVAHGLPIRYVLNALEDRPPQPVLDQVPYAEPFRITAEELATAVRKLDSWAAEPAW
ncbi:MAG TPA: histidine phosphatase family protein [Gaiellaceae bacterium]